MAVYHYTALNKGGQSVTGSLEADNEHALYTVLKGRGLLLQKAGTEKKAFRSQRTVRPEDLIEFSHQMTYIVQSGLPLIQGLADVHGSLRDTPFKSTLAAVINDLAAGDSLAQSMARYPHIFSPAYVAVINAGEYSGNLAEAFQDIARYLEWVLSLKRQVRQAMTYPLIVMVLIGIAMIVFVTYVIPKLVSFILELDRPIPLPTKILIFFNQFVLHWWPALLGLSVAAVFSLVVAMRFEKCRGLWDQYKLKIPHLGDIVRDLALVRFINYLRILYRAGIQIHQSFAILADVVENRFYRKKLDRMRELIMAGESLSDSMEKVEGFPPLVERSFRVGEKTGALETTLEQLGPYLDRQINANVKNLTSLLEPILLLFIGIILIFIIISVIWPIYGILGEIT
ncbi:MAG: type II secretion system F family protein [Deltaproteobacteria bacterium]|nr:type II secretion system F family protein [Deltaproteobacteria bacterium]